MVKRSICLPPASMVEDEDRDGDGGCCCDLRRARDEVEASLGVTAPSELRRDGVVNGEASWRSCGLGGGLEVERCEYTCEESGCRVSWNVGPETVRFAEAGSGNEVVLASGEGADGRYCVLEPRVRDVRREATSADDGNTDAVSDGEREDVRNAGAESLTGGLSRVSDGERDSGSAKSSDFHSAVLSEGEGVGLSTCIARKQVSTSRSRSISLSASLASSPSCALVANWLGGVCARTRGDWLRGWNTGSETRLLSRSRIAAGRASASSSDPLLLTLPSSVLLLRLRPATRLGPYPMPPPGLPDARLGVVNGDDGADTEVATSMSIPKPPSSFG